MRWAWPVAAVAQLATAALLWAQPPPVALVKGEVVRTGEGKLHIADPRQRVFVCSIDSETYVMRQGHRVDPGQIEAGNLVEAIVDRRQPESCRVLTVYVLARGALSPPDEQLMRLLERQRGLLDDILPRGNLTFSGTVVRIEQGMLTLRTRSGKLEIIRLRDDTRYTLQGLPADVTMLRPNLRVFVRAGRDFRGGLEAFQVMAGEIFQP